MSKWIPVSERLPEKGVLVVLMNENRRWATPDDMVAHVHAVGWLNDRQGKDFAWCATNSQVQTLTIMNRKTIFQPRTVGLLATVLLAAGLLSGCGERSSTMYDRWMSELDCPVVLIGKTDKASRIPSVVVRDGSGRVRTMSADSDDGYKMPGAIADSRNIGDTLKPCVSPCR